MASSPPRSPSPVTSQPASTSTVLHTTVSSSSVGSSAPAFPQASAAFTYVTAPLSSAQHHLYSAASMVMPPPFTWTPAQPHPQRLFSDSIYEHGESSSRTHPQPYFAGSTFVHGTEHPPGVPPFAGHSSLSGYVSPSNNLHLLQATTNCH